MEEFVVDYGLLERMRIFNPWLTYQIAMVKGLEKAQR